MPRSDRTSFARVVRLSAPPLCVALLFLAVIVAVIAVPGMLLLTLLWTFKFPRFSLLLGVLLGALPVLIFWRHHWVSGSAMILGFLGVIVLSAVPSVPQSFARWAADLADVVYYHPTLQRLADESRHRGQSPVIAVLDLDGFGSMTSGLAFDPTGQILLPAAKRSTAWTVVGGQTELSIEPMQARHVIGDYYAWFHN